MNFRNLERKGTVGKEDGAEVNPGQEKGVRDFIFPNNRNRPVYRHRDSLLPLKWKVAHTSRWKAQVLASVLSLIAFTLMLIMSFSKTWLYLSTIRFFQRWPEDVRQSIYSSAQIMSLGLLQNCIFQTCSYSEEEEGETLHPPAPLQASSLPWPLRLHPGILVPSLLLILTVLAHRWLLWYETAKHHLSSLSLATPICDPSMESVPAFDKACSQVCTYNKHVVRGLGESLIHHGIHHYPGRRAHRGAISFLQACIPGVLGGVPRTLSLRPWSQQLLLPLAQALLVWASSGSPHPVFLPFPSWLLAGASVLVLVNLTSCCPLTYRFGPPFSDLVENENL